MRGELSFVPRRLFGVSQKRMMGLFDIGFSYDV